ncbi:hypothetical protein BsWGS_27097 [Bradybaena similaris]
MTLMIRVCLTSIENIDTNDSCLSDPGTDTPDTLTLARLDRENQGTWEAEYSYEGEADLHQHFTSSEPQTEYRIVQIRTAGHVVYDESEAAHTTCHLYFDRGGRPEICEGVATLNGMSYEYQFQKEDHFCMSHFTHDLDLAHRLHQRCKQRWDLLNKFLRKPQYIWDFRWSRPAPDKQPLLFIVSHPHGCSKQISIGRCRSVLPLTDKQCGYTYTTATCPGSSGAGVHVLNEALHHPPEIDITVSPPVHRGVCDNQPGMNLSLFSPG